MTGHILITGAASGFGENLTRRYAASGWKVTATMRDTAKAPSVFAELSSVHVARLDIAHDDSIEQGIASAVETNGPVDVLANLAAYALIGSLEETSLKQIRQAFATNVIGTLAVTKAVLPGMRQRRAGHLITFSSSAGVIAMPTFPTYSSTKFALEGYFESLSYDVAHLGIKVTIVEPGAFETQLGVKGVEPETPVREYAAAGDLLPGMFDFSRGNLDAACETIVGITGVPDAPLRLYVGNGLDDVKRRLRDHLDQYLATEQLTKRSL
jgi:short-subunit dehydrogenase